MQVTQDQYIWPPRCKTCIPRSETQIFQDLGWIGQYKFNDSHILIKYTHDSQIQIWNRHAEKLRTYHCPDWLHSQLQTLGNKLKIDPNKITIIDGGLLDQKHKAIKDTIVIWDILVYNDQHLLNTTYNSRYNQIASISSEETWDYTNPNHNPVPFGHKITDDIFIPKCWDLKNTPSLWDTINMVNQPYTIGTLNSHDYKLLPVLEGIVYKDPNSQLEMGFKESNNDSWMCKSRVTTGRHRF